MSALWLEDAGTVADEIIRRLDGRIVLGLPLGLGKANHVANALYRRAVADASIHLEIFTALSLEIPDPGNGLQERFLRPFLERVYDGVPRLDYVAGLRGGDLPANVKVSEFFFQAGRWLGNGDAQQHYVSANYTHAARYMMQKGVNVIAQMVASTGVGNRLSLSSNTDITLDLLPMLRASGRPFLMVGEVNRHLPYLVGEAELHQDKFDVVLDGEGQDANLFSVPKQPVSDGDLAIGLHAASLVVDGGTLQVGIGSIGDAVIAGLIARHRHSTAFAQALTRLGGQGQTLPFGKGLYAATEMFVDGFMNLYRQGILKRPASDGAVLHGGFYLGSREFYRFLRELDDDERACFQMRPISFVNELYGDEKQKRSDRRDAAFINNAMLATSLGAAVSDGTEDGQVVSGVGGQYNFVAQAFALGDARSIMTLNATRTKAGETSSRILAHYGHTTVPRHLRDVFVTEYGVADLRGKSDRDCVVAMIAIADVRFQEQLVRQAKSAGKLEQGFQLTEAMRRNTPKWVSEAIRPLKEAGVLSSLPLGSDFDAVELKLLPAMALLRDATATKLGMARTVVRALTQNPDRRAFQMELGRMGLERPQGIMEQVYARLVAWALDNTRPDRAPA